jgi:predicted Rdx family selenoprotein
MATEIWLGEPHPGKSFGCYGARAHAGRALRDHRRAPLARDGSEHPEELRQELVNELMKARRDVGGANRAGDSAAEASVSAGRSGGRSTRPASGLSSITVYITSVIERRKRQKTAPRARLRPSVRRSTTSRIETASAGKDEIVNADRSSTGRFTGDERRQELVRQLMRARRDVGEDMRATAAHRDPAKAALVERAKKWIPGDPPGGTLPGRAA